MPKGFPKNGFKIHRRWTHATLAPLHRRWMAGENLAELAKGHGTTYGRLRQAFMYFGFDTSNLLKRGAQSMMRHGREQAVEAWKPNQNFDAEEHRRQRHYQGSFDL